MVIIGLVIVAIAAAMHGFIFYLESVAWTSERTRAVFGTTADEAAATRTMAFNQGFYNLFLALQVVAGIVAYALGASAVGLALVTAGAGAMVLAGAVLVISSPDKASAALKQALPPLLGLLALGFGTLLS